MDWVFKASSWELTEMDRLEFDVVDDVSTLGNNQNLEGFSDEKHSRISCSPPTGSSKKRANEQHMSSCLVDGCMADLGGCRDYHRRHRVCEAHSKTPVVSIAGKNQRFCQQCIRFHLVGEFDDEKRSCRKRLDGHNRRRRKPRAESMYLNYGSFWTNHQGTKLLRFGGSPLSWPDKQKLNQSVEQNPPKPSREKKFPFLLGTGPDKLKQLLPEPNQGALYLLSKHTSQSPQTNFHHPQTTSLYTNNNHLIQMIHFRTQEFLENDLYEDL